MTRTIVNISPEDKRWLDQEARSRRVSMTSLVSEAVHEYRLRQQCLNQPDLNAILADTAGIWTGGDGLNWQQSLREEWNDRS
ncbi:MAG: hypothetical protein ACLFSC_10810 [Wenzhouxiangella sp.]